MICFAIRDRLGGMTALVLFLFASSSLLPSILVNCEVYTGAIRLSGGKSPHEGNVQIYYDNKWGFVCDDYWAIGAANVVCKQLGYPKARNFTVRSHFSVLSNPLNIFLDNVQCSGNETALMHCYHDTFGVHNCVQAEFAGVVCQPPENFTVRLTPEIDEYQGVVEIGLLGQWYKVAVMDKAAWDVSKSGILCREMGYPGALSSSRVAWSEEPRNHSGAGNQLGNTVHILCEGHERHISECMIDLPRPVEPGIFGNSVSNVLHIGCQRYSITFAFKVYHNLRDNFARVVINRVSRISSRKYSSGVACGDWSEQDARVVCRQAGFIGLETSKAGNIIQAHKNIGKIAHLGCNGNESGIAQCTPDLLWIDKTCGGQKSLAIKCTYPIPRITSLVSATSRSVEVRWMVENLTETHIITGYDVYYSTPNTQTSMYVSVEAATVTDSVAVIGGLRPFANYTFTVRIKTEYGDTQRSEPWWIVATNASAPRIPPEVKGVFSDGPSRLNITIQQPLSGTNSPLYNLSVVYHEANPLGRNVTVFFNIDDVVDSTLVLTGLTAFTNYSVRVAFVDVNGTGPFSEEIIVTTSQAAPSKVKNLAAVALGSTSVGLSWMAPLQPNGIITKYCVRYRSDSPVINHSGAVVLLHNVTNITIGNLQEYTTYTFKVFGETVGGKGGAAKTTVTLFPAAPASPWNASAIGINLTTVNVSWTPPPPKDRNGPIANYSVICEEKGLNESMEKFTTTTWLIFDNLTSYITYSYRVAAVGLFNGTGAYTKPFQDDIQRVPGPVGDLNISSIQKTSCFVRWDEPSWTNGVISNYILNFTSTENRPYHHRMISIKAQDEHMHEVRGLEESVDYSVSVFAVNQHGVGEGRYLEMKTKTDAPSAPPRAVNVSTEESCIVVSWMPPNLIHQNGPIVNYVVKYGESDARSIKITHYVAVEPQRSLNPKEKFTYRIESTETSLKTDVVYLVQVAAKTDVGVGPFSDSIPVKLEGSSINGGSVAAAVIVVILILVVVVGLILVLVYGHKKWKHVKRVLLQKASSKTSSRQGHIYEEPKCANSKTGSVENVYDIPGVSSSEGCYVHQTNQKLAEVRESGPLCKSTLVEHEECDDVSIGEHTLESRRALRLSSSPDFVDNPLYGSLVQSLPEPNCNVVFVADPRLSVPTLPRNSSVTSPRKEHYSVSYSHQPSSGPTFPKASFSESVVMSELEQRQDSEDEEDVYTTPDTYIFLNSFGSETPHVQEETAVVHESDNLYSHLWTTEPVTGDNCGPLDTGPLDTPNVPPERTVIVESDNPYSHLWSETPRVSKPTAVADESDNLYSHLWTTEPVTGDDCGPLDTGPLDTPNVPPERTVIVESDNPYSHLWSETPRVSKPTAVADESDNLYSHLWTTKPFVADTHGSVETSRVPEETTVSCESDNPYSRLRMETSRIREETAVADESKNLYSHLWTTKTFVEDDRGLTDTANADGYCNFTENVYQNMPSVPRLHEDTSDSESDDDQKPKRINIYDVPRRVLQQHDVVDPPHPTSLGGVPSTSDNDTEPAPQFGVCTTFNTDPCESKH